MQKNKEDVTQAPDADYVAPETTAETAPPSPSSNPIISNEGEKINTNNEEQRADNAQDISIIREEILSSEQKQELLPYRFVEEYYGKKFLDIDKARDYASFRTVLTREKGGNSQSSNTDSRTEHDRNGNLHKNKRNDTADSVDGSASSIPKMQYSYAGIRASTANLMELDTAKQMLKDLRLSGLKTRIIQCCNRKPKMI